MIEQTLRDTTAQARERLARIPLRDAEPVEHLLEVHMRPLYRLLEKVGVEDPAALVAC